MHRSSRSHRFSMLSAAFGLAVGTSVLLGHPQAASATNWPQAHSDLRADPAVAFGQLPNGMRYAIMHNTTPKGVVAMWLCINAGSIQETVAQQGLAHFLEHMAFRGSRHVPEDQVWPALQRLGMEMGADANASTTQSQTVYKLNLPQNDAQSIETGFTRLRDIASELTLSQRAMDDERGPILSEERLRDSPDYRAIKAFLALGAPGNVALSRFPIGKTDVIRHAPISLIRDFYHAYYRPERATLIIVGDIDPKAMQAKITERFSDWNGVGPAGSDPKSTPPGPRRPEAELFVDPGESAGLALSWVTATEPDAKASERTDLIERAGLAILGYRLQSLANGPQPPFTKVQVQIDVPFPSAKFRYIALDTKPQDWRQAVAAATAEVRSLIKFGVTPDEVGRATNDARAFWQAQAAKATTRPSPEVAEALATSIDHGDVFQSPADFSAFVEETLQHLTADQVNETVRRLMRDRGPLLFLTSPTPIEGGQAALTAALEAAEKAPLTAAKAEAAITWPYTKFGAPGQVAERKTIDDLQTTFVRFANGVRLTVKPTAFAKGEIRVSVKVGNGRLGLPPDRDSAAWVFDQDGFLFGGLKAVNIDGVLRALSGKVVAVNTSVGDDGFLLSGNTRPQDFATQLQVLTAYVSAPGWRAGALERARGEQISELTTLSSSPSGVLKRDIPGLLHGGDRRWSQPTLAAVEALGPDGLKTMLQGQLAAGPLDVTVVGDVSVDAAIAGVADTFGALPRRSDPPAPSSSTLKISFPAGTAKPVELVHKGRADQGIAAVAWPASDSFDVQTKQAFRVLKNIIEWRLTEQLRIRDGATYSPGALLGSSSVAPGFGFLFAFSELPAAKMPLFFNTVDAIAADLRTHPVSADELERARKPAVEETVKEQQTNSYWAFALRGAQTDPRRLDIIRNTLPDLQRVTAADVLKTAQTYLTVAKTWKAEIKPEAPKPAPH